MLALGIAYKRNVNDTRESPALEVVQILMERGASVFYSDPYVPKVEINHETLTSINLTARTLRSMDCVVILTDHSCFDYTMIAAESPVILDCRNALCDLSGANPILL